MALFSKKEEEDYEEVEEVVVKRRPKNQAFRDLQSENKKKRKEPPKPWGKKERIILLLIILATAGTSLFLFLSSRAWKLPNLPRVFSPLSKIGSLVGEDTVILEGNKKDKARADSIINNFVTTTDPLTGVYGLYVSYLDNGFNFGVFEDDEFQAASLIKLPVMAGMFMESEKGAVNLDDKYVLKSSDKVAGAGSLYSKPVGYEITYRNLLKLMGRESDNTAFNICRKFLGDEKINEVMRKIGMIHTSLADNSTTPHDIGIFFEGLWNGNILAAADKEELLGNMTNTIYENWLVAGVPEGVKVAHKYGREVHVVNDTGVIFAERPYVVVVMSKGVVDREADGVFPNLSQIVFEGSVD